MLYINGMREDRYLASNLSALENSRWENVLKYQALFKNFWKPLFNKTPDGGLFYGIHKQCMKGCYVTHTVCFNYSGEGISHDYIEERDTTADKFVRCIPEDQLALYINSGSEKVRVAVKYRLKGDKKFDPIPFRQDLVDTYYYFGLKGRRLNRSIEYCDRIILAHFEVLLDKLPQKSIRYDKPILTLPINGRVYIYQDREGHTLSRKFLIKPETVNWIFSQEDLTNNVPVSDSFYGSYKLSVVKNQRWFKA
jgi:hypothetical protein